MSVQITGLEGQKTYETPFEKRKAAEAKDKASGAVRASTSLPGETSAGERTVEDEILLSPEAKAAQRAEQDNQEKGGTPLPSQGLPIGELYQKAVIDRLQDRLAGKKADPEPTLLQRVYSNIRTAEPESEDTPPPTPTQRTVAAE